MSPISLPSEWAAQVSGYPADGGPSGADWIATVPRLIDQAVHRWGLTVSGDPRTGWTAIVVPVLRDGQPLALKVGWPHTEAHFEHVVLRHWAGMAAVRLIAADPAHGLMLLERLDADQDLTAMRIDEACATASRLLSALHVPAPPMIPLLGDYLQPHLERMRQRTAIPRRIVERTHGLAADLLATPGTAVLLHTDLHYENVLARPAAHEVAHGRAEAAPDWVAIDPKPVAGHPGFELIPLLRNRSDDLGGLSFRAAMRRRVAIAAEAADIDLDEAMAWSLVRAGLEVSWSVAMDHSADVTAFVALTKALDD